MKRPLKRLAIGLFLQRSGLLFGIQQSISATTMLSYVIVHLKNSEADPALASNVSIVEV
jgi:hypothetical protein